MRSQTLKLREKQALESKHKKFTDAENSTKSKKSVGDKKPEQTKEELKKLEALIDMDNSSDDDDEAPEEETISSGREVEKLRAKQMNAAMEEQHRKEKERRRMIEEKFLRQKQEREKKLEEEEKIKEADELKKQEMDELPEELPTELLETYDPSRKQQGIIPHKIKFDSKSLEKERQNRIKAKKEKLREKMKLIRKMNRTTLRKGPVKVTVLNSRNSVPGSRISRQKDKWLRRRSIRRRW